MEVHFKQIYNNRIQIQSKLINTLVLKLYFILIYFRLFMSSFNSLYQEICSSNQSVPQFEDYFFRVELLQNKPIQYEKFTGIKFFYNILEHTI
jgi:hypothetical protein